MFKGALAEQLIRMEMADAAAVDPSSVPALEWREPSPPSPVDEKGKAWSAKDKEKIETAYALNLADNFVGRLGECVVRADPASAKAVLLASSDTPEEIAAMKAMSNTISSCVAKGQTLKFNRTNLRAALAVNYYRLGIAARATQSEGAPR